MFISSASLFPTESFPPPSPDQSATNPAGCVPVVAPAATDNRQTNDASIVLLGEFEGRRFLLTGDAEDDVDPILLSRGLPTVDMLPALLSTETERVAPSRFVTSRPPAVRRTGSPSFSRNRPVPYSSRTRTPGHPHLMPDLENRNGAAHDAVLRRSRRAYGGCRELRRDGR